MCCPNASNADTPKMGTIDQSYRKADWYGTRNNEGMQHAKKAVVTWTNLSGNNAVPCSALRKVDSAPDLILLCYILADM